MDANDLPHVAVDRHRVRVARCDRVLLSGYHAMTEPNVYKGHKAGSRKGEVHRVFDQKGADEAMKYGVDKGLKPGTIKSWMGYWSGGRIKVKVPKVETNGAKVHEQPKPKASAADEYLASLLVHATRAKAESVREGIAKRAGTDVKAFHILEQDGKFGVVPAHYKKGGPIPKFEDGDYVMDTIVPNSLARVVGAGPEQSVIKFVKPRPGWTRDTDCVPNTYLYKVDAPKVEAKPKKAKAKPKPASDDKPKVGSPGPAELTKVLNAPFKKKAKQGS
jgi:hypothetical protein